MSLRFTSRLVGAGLLCLLFLSPSLAQAAKAVADPTPQQAWEMLKAGNERFVAGEPLRGHQDAARLQLAHVSNQADHAYATVLSCSDSRVPVETIFEAGIMDLFVVRVAGNVVNTDEAGSIEYGLAHVRTPILVVLGHTNCGAVSAVASQVQGQDLVLERNIPPLLAPIFPAVRTAMHNHPEAKGAALVPFAIEQNVWQAVSDLFLMSPVTRELTAGNKVLVKAAIYDLATGQVNWLPQDKVTALLQAAEKNPKRVIKAMAPLK
ncbi:MAG: carbonic anhydrase [Proteobacteria bacterium]|nr:carbonic anhydrase [Pseudomonadota bacterium]MBU4383791.1 carbonic anhydrase [Pseudomonadota bacterium]MCG2763433.1 carbonic anhydrase [Desulfarculaceae bacterium]